VLGEEAVVVVVVVLDEGRPRRSQRHGRRRRTTQAYSYSEAKLTVPLMSVLHSVPYSQH
jgi:hypothetical protein